MSLRYAILGALTAQPMSGYDMGKHFEDQVGFVWSAPQSQIYPELRRMEQDGLIEAEVVRRGTRATKRPYSITETGEQALRGWLAEPTPPPPDRDTFRLRTVYLDMVSLDVARGQFQAHLEYYERRLDQWLERAAAIREHRTDILIARLKHTPDERTKAVVAFKALAFDGQAARAEAEIAWARSALALIDELEAEEQRDHA